MNKINNIIIYTSGGFPYGGAPENFVRLMAQGLVKNSQRVNIKLFRGKDRVASNSENHTGINVTNLLFKYRLEKEFFKSIELCLLILIIPFSVLSDRLKGKGNTIILYGIDYFYFVFPFMVMSKLLGIKLIRVVTDRYEDTTIMPVWWKKPKLFFYKMQFKVFDKYLTGIVFLSTYLFKEFIKNGGNESKAIVIPHFIDVDQFVIAREPNKKNLIVGYSGSIIVNNGIFDLLDAFKLLLKDEPEVRLLLLGNAKNLNEADYIRFINLIKELETSVTWEGQVAYNDVAAKLQQCSILINPRRKGEWADAGFPTKLGEYFSCEKIVLTTNVADVSKYFTDGQELYIAEPNNPSSIHRKLEYIIGNIANTRVVANNGLIWANDNLHYIKSSQKLIEFIDNIKLTQGI